MKLQEKATSTSRNVGTDPGLLTAHQPALLPWPGFFWKMLTADVMVIAASDQFVRRSYHNRVLMRGSWATLPCVKAPVGTPIDEIRIAPGGPEELRDAIIGRYRDARWWPQRGSVVLRWVELAEETAGDQLWLFNLTLIQLAALFLRIDTQLCLQEPLKERGTAGLIELCQRYGATRYLSGLGGQVYLDDDSMRGAGIDVTWSTHVPVSGDSILSTLFDHERPWDAVRGVAPDQTGGC